MVSSSAVSVALAAGVPVVVVAGQAALAAAREINQSFNFDHAGTAFRRPCFF